MEPIINPMCFYWIDVISGLETLAVVFCVLSSAVVACYLLASLMEEENLICKSKRSFRGFIAAIVGVVIFAFAIVFVPSKETMITMVVAQNVTTENIEKATDTVKSMIDYTVETYNKTRQNKQGD